MKKIEGALISVFHKEGLLPIAQELKRQGVTIYSTGGTYKYLQENGVQVTTVEDITSYPSILGGRVKTLHPKIFGGILARNHSNKDQLELSTYDIPVIDLVIVDLYPFQETANSTNDEVAIIEKIDIGGIALIRAAAKNFKDTLLIANRNQYQSFLETLQSQEGKFTESQRKHHALLGFQESSKYDSEIFSYFNESNEQQALRLNFDNTKSLRYGENPHQDSIFYGDFDACFDQLNGKELSYNNLVDIDATVHLIQEFTAPTCAIIKHTNSCGLASAEDIVDAWNKALACDNISAFGGIIAVNRTVTLKLAQEIDKIFYEVLIAPEFENDAFEFLKQKKNRRLLKQTAKINSKQIYKSCINGILAQDRDTVIVQKAECKIVTNEQPNEQQWADLNFAEIAVKHLKSNGIALVKDQQLIGMGCGQTSRVDALQQAIQKAKQFGFDTTGAVMGSDAFFPFPDCVTIAHKSGIISVIQPGGSIKDKDSIEYCNSHGMSMILNGIRHFKH